MASTYEIVVDFDEQSLDIAAELAEFALERGLTSSFDSMGQVAIFEPAPV